MDAGWFWCFSIMSLWILIIDWLEIESYLIWEILLSMNDYFWFKWSLTELTLLFFVDKIIKLTKMSDLNLILFWKLIPRKELKK